jgi:hypothetical protein
MRGRQTFSNERLPSIKWGEGGSKCKLFWGRYGFFFFFVSLKSVLLKIEKTVLMLLLSIYNYIRSKI